MSPPIPVSGLKAGIPFSFTIPENTIKGPMLLSSALELNIEIDPANLIAESNEGNNKAPFSLDEIFEIPNVGSFSQFDTRWGADEYANQGAKSTMSKFGCAISTVAMIYKSYNQGTNETPGTLNTLFPNLGDIEPVDPGLTGYTDEGWVKWRGILRVAKRDNQPMDFKSFIEGDEKRFKVEEELRSNNPIILKVNGLSNPAKTHFVVAKGIVRNRTGVRTLSINDPGSVDNSFLTDGFYNNDFRRAMLYKPAADPSALSIFMTGGEFLLIDSLGRKLGIDPTTGEFVNEISEKASYDVGSIDNLAPEENPPAELPVTRHIYVPDQLPGAYTLEFHSPDGQKQSVEIDVYDVDGGLINNEKIPLEIPEEGVISLDLDVTNQSSFSGKLKVFRAKAKISHNKKKDSLELSGKLLVDKESDGINLDDDNFEVNLSDGGVIRSYPASSFKKRGKWFVLKEKGMPKTKIRINKKGFFNIQINRENLKNINFNKKVNVLIKVGNDTFEKEVRFRVKRIRKYHHHWHKYKKGKYKYGH